MKARGRPRRSYYNADAHESLKYLAKMAIKNNINSNELFNSLVDAWKLKESTCHNIVIKYRKKKNDSTIFLFTSGEKVLGQFPIPESILQQKNPLESYVDMMSSKIKPSRTPIKNPKIKDLEPKMKHINLKARVLEMPQPKMVYTRWGTSVFVSNILLSDETGTIRLSLWNQQIKNLSVNDVAKIENAKVASFRGERQMRLGRKGKLTII